MARVFNVPRFSHESARIDNQNLYCKANHRTQCGCLAELGVWGMSRCPCFKFELKHILEQISPNLNHYIALFCVEKG